MRASPSTGRIGIAAVAPNILRVATVVRAHSLVGAVTDVGLIARTLHVIHPDRAAASATVHMDTVTKERKW